MCACSVLCRLPVARSPRRRFFSRGHVSCTRRTPQVLSAGEDGALFVLSLDGPAASSSSAPRQQQPFAGPRGSASYRAARWASQTTFVTAGTTGPLHSRALRSLPSLGGNLVSWKSSHICTPGCRVNESGHASQRILSRRLPAVLCMRCGAC